MPRIWVATAAALLLLVACNGDPLNTGSIGSGSSQAPIINTPPQNVTVAVGQTAIFTVSATGTAPLTYQWRRDGNAIAGATQATFTLASAQPTDSGAAFDVQVSNTFGSVTSSDAILTVQ